jgi:hypothetical protein
MKAEHGVGFDPIARRSSQAGGQSVFTTAGDVSARAVVVDGVIYFPDWGGYVDAIKHRPAS